MSVEPVMYLFINTDLKMTKGQLCAQTAHAVQVMVEEIVRSNYELIRSSELYLNYMKWKKQGRMGKTVVLKATEDQLKELIKIKGATVITDDYQRKEVEAVEQNRQQFITVVGFYPTMDLFEIVEKYNLL